MAETLLEGSYQLFDLVTELECEESVKSFQYKIHNLFTLKQTDGSQLAAGCENGTVIVWHENGSSSLEDNQQHDNFIECLTWNRHSVGDHLFATGDRNGVRADRKLIKAIDSFLKFQVAVVWDSNQRVAVLRFNLHKYLIHDICWIDVENFASCSWNGTIFVCKIRGRTFYQLNHEVII